MKMNVFTGVISEKKVMITLIELEEEWNSSMNYYDAGSIEVQIYIDEKKYINIQKFGRFRFEDLPCYRLFDMLYSRKSEIEYQMKEDYVFAPELYWQEEERIKFLLESFGWEDGYRGNDELFNSLMEQTTVEI